MQFDKHSALTHFLSLSIYYIYKLRLEQQKYPILWTYFARSYSFLLLMWLKYLENELSGFCLTRNQTQKMAHYILKELELEGVSLWSIKKKFNKTGVKYRFTYHLYSSHCLFEQILKTAMALQRTCLAWITLLKRSRTKQPMAKWVNSILTRSS